MAFPPNVNQPYPNEILKEGALGYRPEDTPIEQDRRQSGGLPLQPKDDPVRNPRPFKNLRGG